MDDQQLLRYSRHILLPQIGVEGQTALLRARVLLVGAGGLGSPAALYLAAAGVGTLEVFDPDTVDLSNLQRQVAHETAAVGRAKADSLRDTLERINPACRVLAHESRLEGELLQQAVAAADVVVDACDNFATRHAVNQACVATGTPLVSGAAIGFDGQISVFDLRKAHSPCYHCLYPEGADIEEMRCAITGVFAPLVGIIGSLQAAETIKLLTGAGTDLTGRLLLLDALQTEWRSIRLVRDPGCPVCASRPAQKGFT